MPISSMLITEQCNSLNNYFIPMNKRLDMSFIHCGTYTIADGAIVGLDFLKEGQYFRIMGSDLNSGVYKFPDDLENLTPETFDGAIWEMAIPPSFLALCEDIQAYRAKYDELSANDKGFTSESFDGYSYSINGAESPTMKAWSARINQALSNYRRISVL